MILAAAFRLVRSWGLLRRLRGSRLVRAPPTRSQQGCQSPLRLSCARSQSRWSWEPGGDLITLTVRVAAAAVVDGVIGQCRPSKIVGKVDWRTSSTIKHHGPEPYQEIPGPPPGPSGPRFPVPAESGNGDSLFPDSRRIGNRESGIPCFPILAESGIGDSLPDSRPNREWGGRELGIWASGARNFKLPRATGSRRRG